MCRFRDGNAQGRCHDGSAVHDAYHFHVEVYPLCRRSTSLHIVRCVFRNIQGRMELVAEGTHKDAVTLNSGTFLVNPLGKESQWLCRSHVAEPC